MVNIVVGLRNFLQNDNFNEKTYNPDAMPPFYEGFLKGLKDAGNNVLCFQAKQALKETSEDIPPKYMEKIRQFKPDLFILFNNYFWDIHKQFDQPIIVYDVDSPNAYTNVSVLRNNLGRFKYLVNQSDGVQFTSEIIGCDEKDVKYIRPFTEIIAENKEKENNIAFCGANWLWNNWMPVINFANQLPSKEDRILAKQVFEEFLKNPMKSSDEIYKEIGRFANKKLSLNDNFLDVTRLSGIRRLRYLTEIADLGLEIRGIYWLLKDNTFVPFPEVLLSCSNEPIYNIQSTADFFNSAKIGFNTKHVQAKNGFSWRVADILASNACLVSEYAKDLVDLGFKVPMFESPAEAREQCIKLLKNENMRLDIVAHSQEIINKRHRFKHVLPIIEDFLGMTLHSKNMGTLEIVPIFTAPKKVSPAGDKVVLSSVGIQPIMKREKFSVKFTGLPLYKAKRKTPCLCNTYLLGIPFLSILKTPKGYRVNLLGVKKIQGLLSEQKQRFAAWLRRVKTQKRNAKAKNLIFQKFRRGEPLNICIQVSRPGMWCFDYLYDMLDKDPRFNVSIVIMPDHAYIRKFHQFYLEKNYEELTNKGYHPYKGYDFENEKMLDIRKEINPDIMFYTDFWKPHFFDTFYITRFLDKITFLNEYGFSVMQDEKTCAWELNNLVDLYFRPTEMHKKMAQKQMKNRGKNVVVTGSPKLDALFDPHFRPKRVWKKQKGKIRKKRIIWAPHYTDKMPDTMYVNDAFWEIYDFMLEIAEKYKDQVQFVFRPHPVLKKRAAEKWGIEQQEAYYQKWDDMNNAQYYDGDFVDLFMTSDAMIMDSCSFRAEYTAFDKPLFLTLTKTSRLKYNDFGEKLNELFYKPTDDLKQGIIDFIDTVVLGGNDPMAPQRHAFVERYFGKINGRTASENIYHEIVNFLEGEKS